MGLPEWTRPQGSRPGSGTLAPPPSLRLCGAGAVPLIRGRRAAPCPCPSRAPEWEGGILDSPARWVSAVHGPLR